jgi:hypothetical protein
MIARRSILRTFASLCAIAGLSLSIAASAQALVTHQYLPVLSAKLSQPIPAAGPHGEAIPTPGAQHFYLSAVAIDAGRLWVAEPLQELGVDRIDEFDSSTGAFVSQVAAEEDHIGAFGFAAGSSTGETQLYAGEYFSGEGGRVVVYGEGAGAPKATWTGAETPAGSFSETISGIAVDNSTDPLDEAKGDVYVSLLYSNVIDVFHPEADGKEHYVGQIESVLPGVPLEPQELAVSEESGDVIIHDGSALDILEPAVLGGYKLVNRVTETSRGPLAELTNVAVDGSNGEIYLEQGFGPKLSIDQFSATGEYLGRITAAETPAGEFRFVFGLAVDPASHDVYLTDDRIQSEHSQASVFDVFGPDVVTPDVTTGAASALQPRSATLSGAVDPDEAGAATCRFAWGTSEAFGRTAPCAEEVGNGSAPAAVSAQLSGLEPDTTYYYRLQATNANGTNFGEESQDRHFQTSGPGIHDVSVSDVAATSGTFGATIDPDGAPTSYYFQYGPTAAYGTDLPAAPGEAIGAAQGDVDVTPHHVQDLATGTLYHYRVVVISEPQPGVQEVFDSPDQTFTTQTAAVSELPDGRQWEMVSPPDKKGSSIEPIIEQGVTQAATGGGAVSYMANAPTEAQPQGNANLVQVYSSRGPDGWTSRDITLPHNGSTGASVGQGQEFRFFSEDMLDALVQPFGRFVPELSAEASEQTPYLENLSGACAGSCYQPLVTGEPGYANVPAGTVFAGKECEESENGSCGPAVLAATPDLHHVVLSSRSQLAPGAGAGALYEWTSGKLTPISTLPSGVPASKPGLGLKNISVRGAISKDGSRVFWESEGALYVRDLPRQETVQLDVAEPACVAEGECESGGGEFQIASSDGSTLYFTDLRRLTKDSGEGGTEDLYECEIAEVAGRLECKLSDLTPAAGEASGEVQGVLGASEDGSWMYFVANGAYAPGAPRGTCTPSGEGVCDLYARHDDEIEFVTSLSAADSHDWSVSLTEAPARVSPDGEWLAFMSQQSLTGYDNRDAINGRPDAEVYLYDAHAGELFCASCNPTGARPRGVEYFTLEPGSGGLAGGPRGIWPAHAWVAANLPGTTAPLLGEARQQPRYLSDSGRLFFNSSDALVPQDADGTEDVYQYEPPGVGGCSAANSTFSSRSEGCVGLISSGTSAEESAFLDASEDGGDVFFLTYVKLASQDYDNSIDVYDAHECTSASPCYPAAAAQPPSCTTAEACRAAPTPQPAIFGDPSSATFSGAGNIVPEGAGGSVTAKSATRASRLAAALKACKRKPKRTRALCQRRARARYGKAKPRKTAAGRAKSRKAAAKKGKR